MEQVFGAIPSVLGSLGPNADIDEAVVFAAWIRCAGKLLKTRTAPLEFFENRLIIAVQDETWRRHLEELSSQILFKINELLGQGTVKFIEFRIDNTKIENQNVLSKDIPKSRLEPIIVDQSLKDAAMAIEDEALRNQFLSAASSYLAKQNRN